MKRIIALVLAAVMMLVFAVGCGKKRDPKYVGKWEADYMNANGTKYENVMLPIGALFRFELTKDGKVMWHSAVDNVIIENANDDKEMTWEETEENKMKIEVKYLNDKTNSLTMDVTYVDGSLIIGSEGSEIHLNKVDEFTEVDPDALNAAASAIQNFGITQ